MNDLISSADAVLSSAGFSTRPIDTVGASGLVFEDATVLGFLYAYPTVQALLDQWQIDTKQIVDREQLALRRAGTKAWNAYVVLLSAAEIAGTQAAALSAIEEDLTGTRKIVRAGIIDAIDLHAALLPLLPLQAAPLLEAVDVVGEIRLRATTIDAKALDAFFDQADDSVVLRMMGEAI